MRVRVNPDKELVAEIRAAIKDRNGHCCCESIPTPENKCMCEEFKAQINDPDYEGYCHCLLYYKEK